MGRLASRNGNWSSIPKSLGIDKCFNLGDFYAKTSIWKDQKNLFWKIVVDSVYQIMVNIQPKNTDDLRGFQYGIIVGFVIRYYQDG